MNVPTLLTRPPRPTPRWLTPLVTAATVAFAALFLALDAAAAVSLFPLFGLVYGLAAAAPITLVALGTRRRAPALVAALLIAQVAVAPLLDIGPRKAFARAGLGVRPGMTLAEASARMRGFPSAASELDATGSPRTLVFVNDFGSGDRDALAVTLEDGRVVSAAIVWD